MRRFVKPICFIILGLIVCCSPMRVRVDFDEEFNFEQLSSFQFVASREASRNQRRSSLIRDPLFLNKAESEIKAVLIQKGYQEARTRARADFLVAFYAAATNRATIVPPSYRIGRFGRRWVTPGRVRTYKQGTLVIDIIDREQKELVWRGIGSGVLDRRTPVKNLLKAVEKVLSEFPPL